MHSILRAKHSTINNKPVLSLKNYYPLYWVIFKIAFSFIIKK